MKKIIACLALSALCFFGGVASFLTNDVTAYAGWARHNYPRMADKFDRHMDRFVPGWCRGGESPAYGHERRHHEAKPVPPPRRNEARPAPAPAPVPEAPAAPSPQS